MTVAMGPSGKWIEGICADGSVECAASRSLEARLTAVDRRLPPAAFMAEQDIEHVHRLRVSTRRALAALRLYRDWLPHKPGRWMKKRLKKIRRSASEARDLDVLAERLARDYGERAAPVVALIAGERAAVQPAIVRIAERCRRRDRFVRKTGKLLAGVRTPSNDAPQSISFRDWAVTRFAEAAKPFFAALPDEAADTAGLHQFRIRAKALRYTIELVAPAYGPKLRNEIYPVVEELQERLGKVQDHVAAGGRMRKWADETPDTALRDLLRELLAGEALRMEESLREFRAWWTAERVERLRQGLTPQEVGTESTPLPQVADQT